MAPPRDNYPYLQALCPINVLMALTLMSSHAVFWTCKWVPKSLLSDLRAWCCGADDMFSPCLHAFICEMGVRLDLPLRLAARLNEAQPWARAPTELPHGARNKCSSSPLVISVNHMCNFDSTLLHVVLGFQNFPI